MKGTVRSQLGTLTILSITCTALGATTDSVHTMDEIVVEEQQVSEKVFIPTDEMGKLEISTEEITKLPSVGEADVARALKLVPGVSVGNENSAQLIVQGGAPEQNLTLLDGIPMYSVDHFFGFFSPFNAEALKTVSIYKNYFPGEFGSRISSVQSYEATAASPDSLVAGATMGLLSGSFYAGLPVGKRTSLYLAGRRSFTDILESPLYSEIFNQFDESSSLEYEFNTGDVERTPVFNYSDFNGKLRTAGERDTGDVTLYWSRDDLEVNSSVYTRALANVAGPKVMPVYIDVAHERVETSGSDWGNIGGSGRWARRWNDLLYSEFSGGYSAYYMNSFQFEQRTTWYELDPDSMTTVTVKNLNSTNDNLVSELFGQASAQLWLSDWNQLTIGAHGQFFTTDYTEAKRYHYFSHIKTPVNPTFQTILAYPPIELEDTVQSTDVLESNGVGSGWVQDDITIGDKLMTSLAGRVSYYQGTGSLYFSPRLSLVYDPLEWLRFKAGGGRYYQYVSRAEMEDTYLEGDRYFWILAGDNSAPVASADHISAGVTFTPFDMTLDIEGYVKRQENISYYKRSPISELNSFLVGKGSTRGLDVMLQKSFGSFSGWLAYTLSESVVQFGREINNGNPYYSPYDRTHEFKSVGKYERGGFNASASWMIATGTPYSEPIGHDSVAVYNKNVFNVKRAVWGAKNAERFPTYHRLDIAASYTFEPSELFDLVLGGSVFNLYNHKNIRGYDYKFTIDNNAVTGYDDKIVRIESHYMGITPSLFMTVRFHKGRNS